MTEQERIEIKSFLRAKGLSDDIIRRTLSAAENEERVEEFRDSTDAKRYQELRDFEPKPGKATLTQVGETQTYLSGDDRGLPIYQEDIDMINKALPLAKRLIELQKVKSQEPVEEKPLSEMTGQEKMNYFDAKEEKEEQTLRTLKDTIDEVYDVKPEELNMGPDTTENINEISEEDRMNLEAGWYKLPDRVKETMLRSQGIKKNGGLQEKDKQCNKNVSSPGTEKKINIKDYCDKMSNKKHTACLDPGFTDEYAWYALNNKDNTPGQYRKFVQEWDEIEKFHTHTRKKNDYDDVAYQGYKEYGRMPREEKTPELIIDDRMYPTTEEMKKHIDEQCNKNVSDKDLPFPGDITKYSYSNILKRMDDTHRRKNSDYGDAAYQGYKKFGDYYFLVQLHNKLSRLESLTVNNKTQQVKDESIDDTLLDMANYAVMYLESRHRND